MKKQILIVGIAVLLICVGLSGCQEQTSTEKLVTAPLSALVLTLDDLPEGYSEGFSTSDVLEGLTTTPTEAYTIMFYSGTGLNVTSSITCGLLKFDSSNNAHIDYNTLINKLSAFNVNDSNFEVINDSMSRIGDESMVVSVSIYNFTNFHFIFRISNIVCSLTVNDDYLLAVDLAKVVEQRIYDSMS